MFEKDILSSLKMVIDHAKGDRKISEVKVLSYSPKKSRDIIAPSYEDAVNNNHMLPMKVLNSTESTCALSQQKEIRTEVTPDLLKKILKSTAKAKNIDPTQELALQGRQGAMNETVSSTRIKQLRSSCPSMKTLALQNLNLRAKQKTRRVRLVDFPANIERLSLRNSTFEPKSFFSKMNASKMDKLKVLDVGRAIFAENNAETSPENVWPKLNNLEELYLEGAPHVDSSSFLETLLKNYPNLRVLDLEGTEVNEDDLVTIAKFAPNLRELYLGSTSIKDVSIMQLVNSGLRFEKLEVICLCETNVTDLGLESLVRSCQSLRSITVKRSKVTSTAAEAAKKVLPGLQVHRVENTHIYAVFRNQGCDHFSLKHDLRANEVV